MKGLGICKRLAFFCRLRNLELRLGLLGRSRGTGLGGLCGLLGEALWWNWDRNRNRNGGSVTEGSSRRERHGRALNTRY